MNSLLSKATGSIKEKIEEQIKYAEAGLLGEKQIAFELKNSGIDMYVLHDIYLEKGDLSAQIDFLLITRRHLYVIECKNLFGNIELVLLFLLSLLTIRITNPILYFETMYILWICIT